MMTALPLPILDTTPQPQISSAASSLAAAALGPRNIGYVRTLRISVTDHCNFRCVYCMPETGVDYLPREEILTYEEITHVARAAIRHGIREFKLTGGEPLLRRDLPGLVRMLRDLPGCEHISLSTNGLLLEKAAPELKRAGVDRVTVSMDTLDATRFREITRTGDLDRVWSGIDKADALGLGPVKLNVVVMRDHNVDEVVDFAALTLRSPRTVRFIEFMPLGQSKALMEVDQFVPFAEIRDRIERQHGPMQAADRDSGFGPARVFRLNGAQGRVGFIHAMSSPFCSTCNRLRLTPEGQLRSCLFDGGEIDIKPYVRPSLHAEELYRAFIDCVVLRPDQHQHYGNRQMSSIGG